MNKFLWVVLFKFFILKAQIIDQVGNREFIQPGYNVSVANSSTSILNQGRYEKIEFFKLSSYEYYAFWTANDYSLFLGPTKPVPESFLNDLCTLGLETLNLTLSPSAIRQTWENGTFCSSYFCNNDTGINNYFLYTALSNSPISSSIRNLFITYHYSIINICMLCKNTENQKDFIEMVNTNKSKCGLINPKYPAQQISYCQTNKCGDDPSKSICIYTQFRSNCYNWAQRRFYWAMDGWHQYIVFYYFYGNILTMFVFLPLLLFTFFCIIIPTISMTIVEVKTLRNQIIIDNVYITYIRKIFSLYNQACLNLFISEFICVSFSIIDFGSWYKLFFISLFGNLFFNVISIINIIGLLVYGTDTQRAMQGLPIAGKQLFV